MSLAAVFCPLLSQICQAIGAGGAASYGTLSSESAGIALGGRSSGRIWTGNANDPWVFGGVGIDAHGSNGFLNDLWRFDPVAGHWIWVRGFSMSQVACVYGPLGVPSPGIVPPIRNYAIGWKDNNRKLWVMGGQVWVPNGARGYFNDLWKFCMDP